MTLGALIRRPAVLTSLGLFVAIGLVWGVVAARAAGQPSLDAHVRAVAEQLQCPVCHNGESAADSSSEQAAQMRGAIRQQIQAGKSDQQIIQFFHERYGDAILESPPKQGFTALIWIAPVLMLLAGLGVVISAAREWKPARGTQPPSEDDESAAEAALSPEERARLTAVLRRELADDEGFAMDAGSAGLGSGLEGV